MTPDSLLYYNPRVHVPDTSSVISLNILLPNCGTLYSKILNNHKNQILISYIHIRILSPLLTPWVKMIRFFFFFFFVLFPKGSIWGQHRALCFPENVFFHFEDVRQGKEASHNLKVRMDVSSEHWSPLKQKT